jgi:hypothetical protein
MDLKTENILQDAYKEYDIGMVQKMFPKYEYYPPPEPQTVSPLPPPPWVNSYLC